MISTPAMQRVRAAVHSLVQSLAGSGTDHAPYVRGIKLRIGMVAMEAIQSAFMQKALGGAGEDGIKWAPLKPETIAARPIGLSGPLNDKALLRSHGIKPYGQRERGFLTTAQNKRWKMIFRTRLMWLMAKHGMGEGEAKIRAAQIAWATLKSEGAKTRLEVLGGRNVLILRSTSRLFASLSPGTRDAATHPLLDEPGPILDPAPETVPEDRTLRDEPGAVVVGSNVAYAGVQHAKRPFWPEELPAPWAERIAAAAESGVAEALKMILREQPGVSAE